MFTCPFAPVCSSTPQEQAASKPAAQSWGGSGPPLRLRSRRRRELLAFSKNLSLASTATIPTRVDRNTVLKHRETRLCDEVLCSNSTFGIVAQSADIHLNLRNEEDAGYLKNTHLARLLATDSLSSLSLSLTTPDVRNALVPSCLFPGVSPRLSVPPFRLLPSRSVDWRSV